MKPIELRVSLGWRVNMKIKSKIGKAIFLDIYDTLKTSDNAPVRILLNYLWQLGIQDKISSPILRQILTNIDFATVEEIRHEINSISPLLEPFAPEDHFATSHPNRQ
jgi:hypothetical protein